MVDRCVCYEIKFSAMKDVLYKHGLKTTDELKQCMVFGENCGICIPYINLVFETGKSTFDVINYNIINE